MAEEVARDTIGKPFKLAYTPHPLTPEAASARTKKAWESRAHQAKTVQGQLGPRSPEQMSAENASTPEQHRAAAAFHTMRAHDWIGPNGRGTGSRADAHKIAAQSHEKAIRDPKWSAFARADSILAARDEQKR